MLSLFLAPRKCTQWRAAVSTSHYPSWHADSKVGGPINNCISLHPNETYHVSAITVNASRMKKCTHEVHTSSNGSQVPGAGCQVPGARNLLSDTSTDIPPPKKKTPKHILTLTSWNNRVQKSKHSPQSLSRKQSQNNRDWLHSLNFH